jgi:hypothetical protein
MRASVNNAKNAVVPIQRACRTKAILPAAEDAESARFAEDVAAEEVESTTGIQDTAEQTAGRASAEGSLRTAGEMLHGCSCPEAIHGSQVHVSHRASGGDGDDLRTPAASIQGRRS